MVGNLVLPAKYGHLSNSQQHMSSVSDFHILCVWVCLCVSIYADTCVLYLRGFLRLYVTVCLVLCYSFNLKG